MTSNVIPIGMNFVLNTCADARRLQGRRRKRRWGCSNNFNSLNWKGRSFASNRSTDVNDGEVTRWDVCECVYSVLKHWTNEDKMRKVLICLRFSNVERQREREKEMAEGVQVACWHVVHVVHVYPNLNHLSLRIHSPLTRPHGVENSHKNHERPAISWLNEQTAPYVTQASATLDIRKERKNANIQIRSDLFKMNRDCGQAGSMKCKSTVTTVGEKKMQMTSNPNPLIYENSVWPSSNSFIFNSPQNFHSPGAVGRTNIYNIIIDELYVPPVRPTEHEIIIFY